MKNIVVTGANRGIGFELARQLAKAGHRVFATCRTPGKADALRELEADNDLALTIIPLDVQDDASIRSAAEEVASQTDRLDVLINNAGISCDNAGFDDVTREDFLRVLETNSVAPLLVTRAFLPLLAKGKDPLNVIISSFLGSIASRTSAEGWMSYPYCTSKAAVNMVGKMMSVELPERNVHVLLQHPGWVATDMGGKEAPLSPADSAASIIQRIAEFKPSRNGAFIDPDGETIPW